MQERMSFREDTSIRAILMLSGLIKVGNKACGCNLDI